MNGQSHLYDPTHTKTIDLKSVFFLAKMNAPVRGMERERKSFKSGGFIGKNKCTSKGYVEREEGEETFQGSLCSPLKSGGLVGPRSGPINNHPNIPRLCFRAPGYPSVDWGPSWDLIG